MLRLARIGNRLSLIRPRFFPLRTTKAHLHFKSPLKEIKFILNEVLDAENYWRQLGFSDASRDVVDGLLEACASFCENDLAPLYEVGDKEGCKLNADGSVTTPSGFKEAYRTYAEGGWQSLSVPEEFGGQGLPLSLGLIKAELIGTANWSWGMYPGLSIGAMNTLLLHGSPEQKETYVTKLAEGTWTGTMCLTEPQCGTDLGQVRTKAEPVGDGKYKLNGTKIYISCGEHDFVENIIHIVLARVPGASEGTKGISLFLVPKYLPNSDGTLSDKRNISCGGLEKKMGIHGSATCVMNFEDSIGFLIGKENDGLHQMFTFMNTARLGTAIQGLGSMELALQNAVPYAKERLSSRSLTGKKYPEKAADPLIVHPDVRRMLLTIKAMAEGSRLMLYEASLLADKMLIAKTDEDRAVFDNELGLYTPILKGFMTEIGFECSNLGLQVYGGHGYVKDYGMEQIVRDARIATLYEGTTGIQALDLLGRKVLMNKGKLLGAYTKKIFSLSKAIIFGYESRQLVSHAWDCMKLCGKWQYMTGKLMVKAMRNRDVVGSASYDFLMFSGYVSMAYAWLRIARVATKKLKEDPTNEFYQAKLQTAEFYFNRILPRALGHAAALTQDPADMMSMKDENFLTE